MENIAANINYRRLIEDKGYIIHLCNMAHAKEINEAKAFLKEIIKFTEQNRLVVEKAWAIHTLGWIYLNEFKFEKVIENHLRAQEIFAKHSQIKGLMSTYNGLMAVYATQELWDLGIEWGIKAIELAREHKDYRALAALLINIVELYLKLDQCDKAEEIMNQIKEINYSLDKFSEICKYLIYAKCEIRVGKIEESLEDIQRAYELANQYGKTKLSEIYNVMGQIKIKKNDYTTAKKYFKKGIEVAKQYNQVGNILDNKLEWAKLNIVEGNYDEAIQKLNLAKDKLNVYQFTQKTKGIYWALSRAYKGKGDIESALKYLEKYLEIEEVLDKEKNRKWVKQLDFQKIETEVEIYKVLYDQVSELSEIGQRLTATLSTRKIVDVFIEEIKKLIQADCFELATYDEMNKKIEYHIYAEENNKMKIENEVFLPVLWKTCIETKSDLIINNIEDEYFRNLENNEEVLSKIIKEPKNNKELQFKSQIIVPLLNRDKVIGILSAKRYETNAYEFRDLNTLKILGSYVAIALVNAKLFKQVKYTAAHDALTKVLNRREILRKGEALYQKALEQKGLLGIIMIDVDEFKQINDTYGHYAGDQVLKNISEILKHSVRQNDLVGRYGGEEFLVVLPDIGIREVKKIAERIRINVKEKLKFNEAIKTTVSLGITQMNLEIKYFEEAVKRADQALYQAKETGKNKVVVYEAR